MIHIKLLIIKLWWFNQTDIDRYILNYMHYKNGYSHYLSLISEDYVYKNPDTCKIVYLYMQSELTNSTT